MNWGMIAQGSRSGSAQRPAPALAAKSAASMKIVPSAVCLGRPWRNLISREAVLFVRNFSAAREKRTSGAGGRANLLHQDEASRCVQTVLRRRQRASYCIWAGKPTDRKHFLLGLTERSSG